LQKYFPQSANVDRAFLHLANAEKPARNDPAHRLLEED
tara:strand:+ start:1907 stop:2020 length:114 start_codon:yes stop_codon:yes gene_type:complete